MKSLTGAVHDRPKTRFLSEDECAELAKRAGTLAVGGGDTGIQLESTWMGNIRYGRNHITTSGDVRNNSVSVLRNIRGAFALMACNQIATVGLQAAVRRAERVLKMRKETGGREFQEMFVQPPQPGSLQSLEDIERYEQEQARRSAVALLVQTVEPYSRPKIFFDTTYGLDASQRAKAVESLVAPAREAGLVAAGYLQVSAHGRAVMDSFGRSLYYPFTKAQFSVTVRDPKGMGSGWAGVDFSDWTRVDAERLAAVALDKCQRSLNPVAVEPGRYTAILEPQAVCDLFEFVVKLLDRLSAENGNGPFSAGQNMSRIGQRIFDERITLSSDPMDPDLGFAPFDRVGNVYHAVNWIENGVLKNLSYFRPYGIKMLGKNTGLPNSQAFKLSGGSTSIEEMVSTTKRGLLVTRFSNMRLIDIPSVLCSGYTRDGLWLIENGRITKPVKNFRIVESPMFAFNNLESLGEPVRVFRPSAPAVCPPAKVRDFAFTSLSEAI